MLVMIPAQTMKFSIKDFFSKFDSFGNTNLFSKFFSKSFIRIRFTKKPLMGNFIFCAANYTMLSFEKKL